MACDNCPPQGSSINFDTQCFYNSACLNCSDNDCGTNIQNARCVIYTGPNLPCSGIETNDSLELAIQKIDEQICSVLGDYSNYQFHCLEEFFGDDITTEADFVDAITDYTCELRADYDDFVNVTFEDYKTTVNTRFVAIEQPQITCVSAGVTSGDSLITVLNKYCETFEDIYEELSIDGVDWDQCLTVTSTPTNIHSAFSLLVDQICQVKDLVGEEIGARFNNSTSCIEGGTSDTLATTISLIKTRLCESAIFDKDDLSWSCLTEPTYDSDQDISAALQEIIDLIVDIKTVLPTFDTGDFAVSQTSGDVCDGITVELQSSLVTDRFAAVSALDASPATLVEKLDAGTGISITNNADSTLIIANTLPDVEVILNEGLNITITGTYPEFTINAVIDEDDDVTDTNFAQDDLTFTGDRTHNLTGFTCSMTAGVLLMDAARFETDLGGDVTSSNNLTLGLDGNVFKVTGNTQINAITTSAWQAGSQIILEFTGAPTLKHNTAGGAGTAPLFLAGSVDFVAAAGDSLSLYYNGTHWHEHSRQVAATATSIIFRNGLNEISPGIAELGGTLLHSTTINSNSSPLIITGSVGSASLDVTNTSNTVAVPAIKGTATGTTGVGVVGVGNNNVGVQGQATAGTGVYGIATTGVGGTFIATTGYAGNFQVSPATLNTVAPVVYLTRATTGGTPTAGIGSSIIIGSTDDSLSAYPTNMLESIWTNVTHLSRTSSFTVKGLNAGAEVDLLTLAGEGSAKLRGITATEASAITGADGMLIYVNSTNGTFTSVGFWGRENSAWVKL